MTDAELVAPPDHTAELADIQREIKLTDARHSLACARNKLAEVEGRASPPVVPWWRSGMVVTSLTAIVSGVVPLTTQIQSWKEQILKEKERNYELREKYLNAVIRDPRQEKRVLEFIVATADDTPVKNWATTQLKQAVVAVESLDETAAKRKRLYLETIGVVAELAEEGLDEATWKVKQSRFWQLYKTELLEVESPAVESLMVKIGRLLGTCTPGQCKAIEDLSFQLARQMKAEISADAANSSVSPPIFPAATSANP